MRTDSLARFALTVAARPAWFTVATTDQGRIRGTASLGARSAGDGDPVGLDVSMESSGIRVREAVPGTRFPARCFERHIEDGGWFCLGLSSGWVVKDAQSARDWWSSLGEFLRLQRVAARTGLWPDHNALSHGEAGRHHRDALALADEIGLLDEYERHIGGDVTVVSSLHGRLAPDGKRLLNGRAPCPCGRHRRGKPVLRRNCPRRAVVEQLLAAERCRVVKLEAFWTALKGTSCCGTMKCCPLARAKARAWISE